jgi:replication fork protection complex subunit Tof1/Swi1
MEDKPDTTWIIPSALSSNHLEELHRTIEKSLATPWTDASGRDPEDLLRRIKTSTTTTTTAYNEDEADEPPRNAFLDDSEGSDDLHDFLFPDNVRSRPDQSDDAAKKNPKKRKLTRKADTHQLAEDELAARRKAREQATLDRRRKIKSELYIRDSDEEMDEDENRAFFAREEENRVRQAERVRAALRVGMVDGGHEEGGRTKKRRRLGSEEEEEEEEEVEEVEEELDMEMDMMDMTGGESDASRQKRAATSDDELEIDDTPLSSQSQASLPTTTTAPAKELALREIPQPTTLNALPTTTSVPKGRDVQGSDEEVPVLPSQRRRVRAGFILDDSDEE